MVKHVGEPVKVHEDKDSIITAFIWRKRLYRVSEVIGWWREPDDWWSGKAMRFFVRVNAEKSGGATGTYELYRLGKSWFLSKILD